MDTQSTRCQTTFCPRSDSLLLAARNRVPHTFLYILRSICSDAVCLAQRTANAFCPRSDSSATDRPDCQPVTWKPPVSRTAGSGDPRRTKAERRGRENSPERASRPTPQKVPGGVRSGRSSSSSGFDGSGFALAWPWKERAPEWLRAGLRRWAAGVWSAPASFSGWWAVEWHRGRRRGRLGLRLDLATNGRRGCARRRREECPANGSVNLDAVLIIEEGRLAVDEPVRSGPCPGRSLGQGGFFGQQLLE